jgi:hypothetical protein
MIAAHVRLYLLTDPWNALIFCSLIGKDWNICDFTMQ